MLMARCEHGMTLMEVLVASTLALGVIWGVASVDLTRFRIQQDLLTSLGVRPGAPDWRTAAALATFHVRRRLENADRWNLLAGNNIQIRIPIGPTFDAAADYRWDQYRYDAVRGVLRYYSDTAGGCGNAMDLAAQITRVLFQPVDEAPTPPGGEPSFNDSNVLSYDLDWDNGAGRSHTFSSAVTPRSMAYTDVETGLQDPSVGDVSPPPAGCNT